MKRSLVLSFILMIVIAGFVMAGDNKLGIGLYGNLVGNGTGAGGGIGLTFRTGTFPVVGLKWNLQDDLSIIGLSVDWWIINQHLVGLLSYYIGLGAYVAIWDISNDNTFEIGGRIPFGLQIFPIEPLEIFLEAAPVIVFLPTIDWNISARLGFRILF